MSRSNRCISDYTVSCHSTPQDHPKQAGAPDGSDAGAAEDCCHQRRGAVQAHDWRHADSRPARVRAVAEADGGLRPDNDREDQIHRQLNQWSSPKDANVTPFHHLLSWTELNFHSTAGLKVQTEARQPKMCLRDRWRCLCPKAQLKN